MGNYDSVKLYRLKRILEELSNKSGRGTELVSLYVPPRKAIHEVITTLREEYGTASNIKSDSTRSHVLDALTKTMQRLKLYNDTPENGLVIFCGALPTNGIGSEVITVHEVVPIKPLQAFLYRCDDHFHTNMLKDMLKEEKIMGILSIDSSVKGSKDYKILIKEINGRYDAEMIVKTGKARSKEVEEQLRLAKHELQCLKDKLNNY